jgi:predicted dehydrogenase
MSDEIRLGLVGTGMMGCEHLRNIAALEGARVVALHDPSPESRQWADWTLAETGDAEGVEWCASAREVADACDALVVASPNHTHRTVLEEILASGAAVMIEKPLCTTAADVQWAHAVAAERAPIVWVGLEYRWMPAVARLLGAIDAGSIGRVRMISIREHRFPFLPKVDDWNRFTRNTGGTLVEKCCHFFDLMHLVTRSEPVRVMASGGQDVNHLDERYDGEAPDILDNAFVIVEFADGSRGLLDLCMFAEAGRNEQEIVAVGDRGKLEALVPEHVLVHGDRATHAVTVTPTPVEDVGHVGFHHGASFRELAAFCAAVRTGAPASVDTAAGAWSVAVGVAAHRSIDTGAATELADVWDPDLPRPPFPPTGRRSD